MRARPWNPMPGGPHVTARVATVRLESEILGPALQEEIEGGQEDEDERPERPARRAPAGAPDEALEPR